MKWTDQEVCGVEFRGEGHHELQWGGESLLCLGQGRGRIGSPRPSWARQGGGWGGIKMHSCRGVSASEAAD